MIEIREYQDYAGKSPFRTWFNRLDANAAQKVAVAVYRIGLGNFSNVKGVGSGVFECKIDFGPGYRVYFGKDGEVVVILLAGGSKSRQHKDVESALGRWQDYKQRKKRQRG